MGHSMVAGTLFFADVVSAASHESGFGARTVVRIPNV